jgi:hypothetical protein
LVAFKSCGDSKAQQAPFNPIKLQVDKSLLSFLSKLFEIIVLDKLKEHTSERKIIPVEQFGFTAGLSTSHQLYRIVCNVKAFDTVWHWGLIYKLHNHSFLIDRSFQVFIDGTSSH